ncbi:MAG: DUF1837 domain-containing protein [Lachnospiraceae bacterium]|nr:DUF1837 domain-containing protein [Lachnospiraceae bacterium]
MKHICFGTFIKVLLLCKDPLKNVTQHKFGQTLISSVNDSYGPYVDETTISNYARCERSLASEITTATASANRDYVVDYFEKHIIPQMDMDTLKKGICAFKDIIDDEDIEDPLFKDPDVMKSQWLRKMVFVPSEVLADLFLIAGRVENHYGKESVAFIDKAYLDSFSSDSYNITFNARVVAPDVILTKTLQEKYFCKAFMPVVDGNLRIKGNNHIKAFRYRIESNRFDYIWVKKLLNANIGRYVFNRAEIEKYLKDDVESLGMEAAQYVRAHTTGNELGEMLIYAFLEEVLRAPKLMSAIELSAEHRCSGIHFLTIPGTNTSYELVYGASDLQGNLDNAVDRAFEAIEKLRASRLSGMELVNSAEFNKCIDVKTAHLIRKIVIPEDGGDSDAGTAYGIFLGYTLDLNPDDFRRDEYTDAVVKKIEKDIDQALVRVHKRITDLRMGADSFYIYVLPFNDADKDKSSIMNELIGGTV